MTENTSSGDDSTSNDNTYGVGQAWLSNEALYELYQRGDRSGVILGIWPRLRLWAKDALRYTEQDENWDWRAELAAEGCVEMIVAIDDRLASRKMTSGKHLVNSVRLCVRKSMRAALEFLSTSASMMDDSTLVGVPDRDLERSFRWWQFLEGFCEAAAAEAHDRQRKLMTTFLERGATTTSDAASMLGISREGARDSLRRLGPKIVDSATPDLRDLAEEFVPSLWGFVA